MLKHSAEVNEIASLLEDVQIDSENKASQNTHQENEAERYLKRRKFHVALQDSEVSDAYLANLTKSFSSNSLSGEALDEYTVNKLRQKISNTPITFTRVEPPYTTATIANSFSRVWPFVQREIPTAKFLFATDLRYRPHASVQEWSPDWYLILMGRYLLDDVGNLAIIFAKYIGDLISELGDEPWQNENFDSAFTAAMERCDLRYQFPYQLCGSAEGERYRFGVQFSDDSTVKRIAGEIKAGAIDFLVAHELGHVVGGHLREPAAIPDIFPDWLIPTCEALRSNLGDKADSLLSQYRKHYLSLHERELFADTFGLLCASGMGPKGAMDLRLFGAQIVVCLISFLDRAQFLIEYNQDPAAIIGLKAYNSAGMVDLLLPKTSHPWGKTRASRLNGLIFDLFQEEFSKSELERKTRLMLLVQNTFARYVPYALGVMSFVNSRPGEYVSILLPEGKLWTRYFPAPDSDDIEEEMVTIASEFYGTASSILWQEL